MKKIKFSDLILFENDHYIVVNKPPFVSSLDDRNDKYNMLALAKGYNSEAQLCHRLDKETTGALVIAKTPEAYRSLSMQFEDRKVNKTYHAVVEGTKNFKNEIITAAIQKSKSGGVKIDKKGKSSQTTFNTIKIYKGHTLMECAPKTGRMHQIRIHLSYAKCPIVNDEHYGGSPFYLSSIKKNYRQKDFVEEQPLIRRAALHAFQIAFKDVDEKTVSVAAPYPKDFRVLVNQLEKNC